MLRKFAFSRWKRRQRPASPNGVKLSDNFYIILCLDLAGEVKKTRARSL